MKVGGVMFFTDYAMHPPALARAMEERGFESLWVPEHSHIPEVRTSEYPAGGGLVRAYYDLMDPFLALTAAAVATTRLKVGTGVCLVNQRDPIHLAKEVSTLDSLSSGRFLFGVGNGWNREEMENHGTVFETRHKLVRERIEAMQRIWTEDRPQYQGEFVRFEAINQWPKPAQKPHPPIIVGGAFPFAARRAIRYGNGWIPRLDWIDQEGIRPVLQRFHAMAHDAGRDPASLPVSLFRVPDDPDRLRSYQEAGVERVVFSLPAETEDKLLPILDRWASLQTMLTG